MGQFPGSPFGGKPIDLSDIEITGGTATLDELYLPDGAVIGYSLTCDGSGKIIYIKNNLAAAVDPAVTDDESEGYTVNSLWMNTTSTEAFRCLDATEDAAVWEKTTLTLDDLGSIATQNANNVAITGGAIDGTIIGGTTPAAGSFTTLKGFFDEIVVASSGNLSASYFKGIQLNNYGQGAADNLQALPTAAEGMTCTLVCGTAQAANYFGVQADTNDKIYLDGTPGSDNGIVKIAAPVVGAEIQFKTFQTGEGTYDWIANTVSGLWVAA